MKRVKLIAFILILAIGGCGAPETEPPPQTAPSVGIIEVSDALRVLIDPGHGGFDPGAVVNGVREDELNLAVSRMLRDALEEKGHTVAMTRTGPEALAAAKGEDMAARRELIKEGWDVVLSVHMNVVNDGSVTGPMAFCYPGSDESRLLAECVLGAMNEALMPSRPKRVKEDDLFVLRSGEDPAVLIECGFMSNGGELDKLRDEDYQWETARAIARGVEEYARQRVEAVIPQ